MRVPAEFHRWYLFVPLLVLPSTTAGTFVYHRWYNPTCSVLVRPASAKIEHSDMFFRANGLKSHAITWNVTQNLTQCNTLIYSKKHAFCVRLWHFSPTLLRARVKEQILNEINANVEYLRFSVIENNNRWGTLYTYTWPNNDIWGNYRNEVQYMKGWLHRRLEWMRSEIGKMDVDLN